MNVYDFDGTIYNGDSTVDFYFFCLRKDPFIIKALPKQISGVILYLIKRIEKTKMKEMFYSFFKYVKDIDKNVEEFWQKNEKKIYKWYLEQKQESDIVISASPDFLLYPICQKLGIKDVIASKVNKKYGKYSGKNCRGEEKVHRFNEKYNDEIIEKFFSDSKSDFPLAKLAKEAFFIRKGKIKKWNREMQ